ncbi:KH domain-containing protein akap-1-like [Polistes fuscatus]|uniref:KH domain-containing protein akap-1-like n=1 Tax=Polistes fuscatus TaxID=30207 RepID=UPI001CA8D177|nr:KH domain-containing protein akap-1-like [Polistes fuscatus]XP_043488511.1 KH domain-containing protein akap-1-like [Polistes fuscatus]
MSSTHYQIIKWSFPAVALIVGLFWYKRRRADRADPGGINTSNVLETIDKLKDSSSRENVNLSDSGINANDFYSSLHAQSIEEPISNCKEVSEQQVDISTMLSASSALPVLMPVASSLKEIHPWYESVENICHNEVSHENHPDASNFQMTAGNMDTTNYYNDVANNSEEVQNVYVNNSNIEQNNTQLPSPSMDKQNEINHTSDLNEQTEQLQNYPPEEENKNQTQSLSERDSANYSPVSGVLEGSVTDEARSEGSTDSGKGGSIEGQIKEDSMQYLYEFAIRNDLVGKLIGRNGSFLNNIRTKAGVYIVVKRYPMSMNEKICAIQGSNNGISIALDIIRRKFPEKKYPDLTLQQIIPMTVVGEIIPVIPVIKELSLIEALNNDVSVCYVIKPNRFFVHIPTHPTHPMLRKLDTDMAELYNSTIPPMPDKVSKGMVLAAPVDDGKWARVYVVDPDSRGETNLVRLVDHGGYRTYPNCRLRQIRTDFLSLPFQAIEVFLANIKPKNGEWHPDSLNIFEQIVTGRVGLAQIVAYINTQVHINLFFNIGKHGIISVADELIAREYAEPVSWECLISSGNTEVSL